MIAGHLPVPFVGRKLAFAGVLVTVDMHHAWLGPGVRLR